MSITAAERAIGGHPAETGELLLALPEDQWLERKSARIKGRDLADAMIGFANADGGLIVVGLCDGKVEGISAQPKRQNDHLQANLDFCEPPVHMRVKYADCINDAGTADKLLVLDIEPGEMVHANKRDEIYLRVGDENRKLTFVQRQELIYDKGQSVYESHVVPDAGLDDLDRVLLDRYAAAVGSSEPDRLLEARGLFKDKHLTIAGCLLFSPLPQRIFPEAFIRVLRYRGTDRGAGARQQVLRDVRLEGPLPKQMVGAQELVRELQPVRRALTDSGRFGDVPLVPEDAWLEGIVNAAVHRSYSSAGDHIRVEIFDDRFEISSPGRFPGLVDLSEPLGATRFARNPRIARVCADLNFGQELGEGIRRMFEEMRHAGLTDPLYRQTSGSVELTLFSRPADQVRDLSERGKAIVTALRKTDRLSTGEVGALLSVSRPVAQRELSDLKEAGLVEWVGKSPRDPRAYWRLALVT